MIVSPVSLLCCNDMQERVKGLIIPVKKEEEKTAIMYLKYFSVIGTSRTCQKGESCITFQCKLEQHLGDNNKTKTSNCLCLV